MVCNKLEECYAALKNNINISGCVNDKDTCIEFSDTRTNPKCEENGKKYIINNEKNYRVTLYKIDGGVIVVDKTVPSDLTKCDYLFCIQKEEKDIAVLVELKGTDVQKALKQIRATYEMFKSFLNKFDVVNCRVIVTNATPKIYATPAFVSIQRELKRKNGDLLIHERQMNEKI